MASVINKIPLKLGKTEARPKAIKFRLKTYVPKLPTPPDRFGHYGLINEWEMLGNDSYGDCVLAGAAHETMMWTAEGQGPKYVKKNSRIAEDMFDDDQVLEAYSEITGFRIDDPSTDQGTDMEEAANWRRHVGLTDKYGKNHKVEAYLGLNKGDFNSHKVAAYLFGIVGIGFLFPNFAWDQFYSGRPWDINGGDASLDGGPYVPIVGFEGDLIQVISWGRVQSMTRGFFAKYNDESITYLSKEMMHLGKSPEGVRIRQLKADRQGLG